MLSKLFLKRATKQVLTRNSRITTFRRHILLEKRSVEDFFKDSNTPKPEFSNFQKIEKNIYEENENTKAQTEEEIQAIKASHEITVSESIRPINSFDEVPVDPNIIESLKKKFADPTPIQKFAWPVALSGKNIVGVSITGSGKTLSFGLPMLHHIKINRSAENAAKPLGLVLCPTWELTKQVNEELNNLGRATSMKGTSFVGGEHFTRQLAQFRFANDFAVATPGRLLDLVARGVVNINHVSYLVLDEADRMIDMGFAPQIRAIFEHIRPDRICTMWSATWPRQVSEIAVDYISDPVMIKIGKSNLTANKDIKQTVMLLDERAKSEALVEILKKRTDEKGIIFCNTTANCDYLSELMQDRGINNIAMHGRRTRDNRIKAFDTFKNGNAKIMIATDVASRGLDIKDVNFIVVYDFPEDIEDYVHRIGRTGRAGKRGEAYAFFTKRNISNAKALKELLETSGNEVPDNLISLSKMV